MDWKPVDGVQLLAPFNHQVAGQSSMLKYDATTVCKPLIGREHFVYKTLPEELKAFTPEYRGEIEVQLTEEEGYIQLLGMPVQEDKSKVTCPCSNDLEVACQKNPSPTSVVVSTEGNRCMVRVLRSGSYEFNSTTDEVFCAEDSSSSRTQKLNPWSLKNHKRLLDKLRKSEHSHNTIRFMLLKNVVADFKHPCILDLKIGSRLHGDDASQMKVASQLKKCKETTSSTLGLRLCGMQVYHIPSGVYHSVDKYHGRTLNDHSFKQLLRSFLHNSLYFRSELVMPIVDRLSQLRECLKTLNSYRFYASSLLIIYDGDVGDATSNVRSGGCRPVAGPATPPDSKSSASSNASSLGTGNTTCGLQAKQQQVAVSCPEKDKLCDSSISKIACKQHSSINVPQLIINESKENHEAMQPNDTLSLGPNKFSPKNCLKSEEICSISTLGKLTDDQNGFRKDNSFISSGCRTVLDQHSSAVILENLIDPYKSDSVRVMPSQTFGQTVSDCSLVARNSNTSPAMKREGQDFDFMLDSSQLTAKSDLSNCSHTTQGHTSSAEALDPNRILQAADRSVKFDVKMIDFAHTTHKGFVTDRITHTGPDTDYIAGLENLIKMFLQLLDDASPDLNYIATTG